MPAPETRGVVVSRKSILAPLTDRSRYTPEEGVLVAIPLSPTTWGKDLCIYPLPLFLKSI